MDPIDTATDLGAGPDGEGARQKTAREEMLDRIDERREQELAEQVQQQVPSPAAATDGEAVLVDDPKRFKLRVKIGEREEEKSLDTFMNELQSSQGRLRSLSQREKDLMAELTEKDRLLNEQIEAQRGAATVSDDEFDARVGELAAALGDGEVETAKTLLREVFGKGRQAATPINEAQLVGKVKAELSQEKAQEERAKIWDSFVAEHPEFQAQVDPDSGVAILSEERKYGDYIYERDYRPRIAAGEISYQQALIETAAATRKVFAPAKVEPDPEKKGVLEERRERKRQLDQLPVAAGARGAGGADAQEESVSETIREMRKARGLPV